VHGDLKAANVMLVGAGADPHGLWHPTLGRRIVAKVADFGLAVSLGPSETHASLTARVSALALFGGMPCQCVLVPFAVLVSAAWRLLCLLFAMVFAGVLWHVLPCVVCIDLMQEAGV
jgi:hypothetical protein